MTALTVGITTAKYPDCKRGVATNLAASLARHSSLAARVAVVDLDPMALDVTTRLAVRGPAVEDFVRKEPPNTGQLGHLHSPEVTVVPCDGSPLARVHLAAQRALPLLAESHDVVVCDLPGGASGPGLAVGNRLELLDWLVLAVTPEPSAVAATAHFLELFEPARSRGDVGDVKLAVVATGDESCTSMNVFEVEAALGRRLAGRVPQLWGRSIPNRGFGPALAIP
jgi:cellulose biosynthesis protein BcsQ